MDIDKLILNIPQLKRVIINSIEYNKIFLKDGMRIIGLKQRVEYRQETLNSIIEILKNHKECKSSPDGKHKNMHLPDPLEIPYCIYCNEDSQPNN